MKKRMAIMLAALMVSALISMPVMAEEADMAGTWYVQSMEMDGTQMDASVLALMGISYTLDLNEDGTAVLAMGEQKLEGTWDEEGLNTGANIVPLELVDGELKIDQNGGVMIFSREAAEAEEFSMAPVVENPELSDFNGNWNAVTFVTLGVPLPIKLSAATDINLQIQDGAVAYTEMIYDLNNNSELTETIEKEFTATLGDDGTLFVDFSDEHVLINIVGGASGIRLTLHEDGTISGDIPELLETMEMLAAMSQESENTDAEAAAEEEGSSDGSSGGELLSSYFVFEKAE